MSNEETTWQLVSPEGVCKAKLEKIASRPSSLEGKTVGLYWNTKPRGKEALNEIANLLSARVKDIKFIRYWEALPESMIITGLESIQESIDQKVVHDMVGLKPDIVLCSQGDCGGCTGRIVRNAINLEALGVPTATITTTSFIQLARFTSLGLGMPDQCFVEVSHPMGGISLQELKAKIDSAFPDIVNALTQWKPSITEAAASKPAYPAETINFKGTMSQVQDFFFKRGLATGLPFVPPTKELVEKMLTGTSHSPDEIVWDGIPPRMGIVTVELVAVCAAMAGCKPEYMPVLLAIIEGLKDPVADYTHQAITTGPLSLLFLVNGPIVKEIGLAYGTGAAGLCYHANASIGYAIGLIGKIIGGSKPPDMDKSTLASPADLLQYVFGENENENPWESYAVEHGFKRTDNVVTVKVVFPALAISDHNSTTGGDILNYTAYNMNQPYVYCMKHAPVLLGWCPEHAATLARDAFTKDSIREYLWRHARYPASAYPKEAWDRNACKPNEDFPRLRYGSKTLLPIVAKPEDIQMIVCGGAGKHSHYWPGPKVMVSKLINPWK